MKHSLITVAVLACVFLLYTGQVTAIDANLSARFLLFASIVLGAFWYGTEGGLWTAVASSYFLAPFIFLSIERNGIGAREIDLFATVIFYLALGGALGTIFEKIKKRNHQFAVMEKLRDIFAGGEDFLNGFRLAFPRGTFRRAEEEILSGISLPFLSNNTASDDRFGRSEILPKNLMGCRLTFASENFGAIFGASAKEFSREDYGFFKTLCHLTASHLYAQKQTERAIIDPLTGLFNRRYWHEWEKELKPEVTYSVIALDIDFFKKVNDALGHAKGDEVLVGLARILQEAEGVAFRLGGEEFAIILEKELEEAKRIAESIRQVCEKTVFIPEISAGSITVSIGVASGREGLTKILQRADIALYRAKREGRNRVVADNTVL
ncbi:GGDEF domain-containing protein [Candidatus Microgenomates bacterium]|nr:GGDEF domain-containing protein [Candidatus Microgenomates bacterium]